MIRVTTWTAACALAATLMATSGSARAQIDMCPPQGHGVPWEDGPPVWRDFTGAAPTPCGSGVDCHFDDPRWRGAAALTYTSASGSANPPVQFRTLWAPDGSRALYMQWLVRIAVSDTSGAARGNAHDIFFGFERPGPGVLAEGEQRGWMVRLHLGPAGTVGDALPARPGTQDIRHPSKCPTTTTCDDNADYFQVYSNFQAAGGLPNTDTGTCTSLSGPSYIFTAVDADPLWLKNSIQYERVCTGTTQDTCNLWVVSVRVPLNAVTSPRAAEVHMTGIEEVVGTEVPGFWYQVNFSAWDADPADPFSALLTAKLDGWPRSDAADVAGTGDSLCTTGGVFYKDLDADSGGGPNTGPAPWAPLRPWNGFGGRAGTCYDGITLTPDDIGVITRDFSAAAPVDTTILAATPETTFKAYNTTTYPPPNTSPRARNTVFARPRNQTGLPLADVKLKARFRLAHWGAQPAMTPESVWTDVPGSTDSGVCAATPSGGLCGNVTIPAGAPNNAALIKLEWTIGGDDASVDANDAVDFCKYGLEPPAASGFSCSACTTTDGKPGTQVTSGGAPTGPPCTRALWNHQCMLVELDADSAANFENASVYQNMDVQGMSETSREAMISVRGMPAIAGARDEEVYLVVMPRNMPANLPPSTTGTTFVQQNAAAARDALLAPYIEAAREMPPGVFGSMLEGTHAIGGNTYGGGRLDPVIYETPEQFPQSDLPEPSRLMPRGSRAVAEFLDGASRYNGRAEELTLQTLDSLDNITATSVLPTLDVYAFRRDKGTRLVPMTSFTLIVHHEGPLAGITWEIDGATRLAHNLFKVDMPVGHRRRINLRVMAKEHDQDRQRRGNEKWPCTAAGCCKPCVMSEPDFALGNGAPLLIVGAVLAVRRRRKGKDAPKA